MTLSFIATENLLYLNLSSFNGNEIYQKFKTHFLVQEIDSSLEDDLSSIIERTGAKKTYFEILMSKLYLLLNEKNNQKTIIDFLVKMFELNHNKFINVLENIFNLKQYLKEYIIIFKLMGFTK